MGSPKHVSIVVLTWNAIEHSKKCIASIFANTSRPNFDLIVVDNGSSDGTLEWLRALPNIKLIENGQNLGFGAAANIGISAACPDADILLLNNDVVIGQSDWLSRLQDCAYSSDRIGIVGCRQVGIDGLVNHFGSYVGPASYVPQKLGAEHDVGQYVERIKVESVIAAVMYIKREVIKLIGGFHFGYFAYYEDTDYCLAAKFAGYEVWYAGDVCLYHCENTTSRANNIDVSVFQEASRQIFYARWHANLEAAYTNSVVWRSAVYGPGGYANSARNLLCGLHAAKTRVSFESRYPEGEPSTGVQLIEELRSRTLPDSCATVVFDVGDEFCRTKMRGPRVGYTMLEVDGIPSEWVRQMNAMDEVWAPSSFNADIYKNFGVNVPVRVAPLGVNTDRFHPGVPYLRKEKGSFVFLSVFAWGERKNPKALLRAFNAEFKRSDSALLVIYATGGDWHLLHNDIASLRLDPNGGRIQIFMNVDIPDYQMPALYRSADAFVTATRGEGWGLPILEAMAVGLPVIATDWSAHKDFFDSTVGYPVDVENLIDAVAPCPYYAGFRWAAVSEDHLRARLRYVYEHPVEAKSKGVLAAKRARKFSWSVAASKINDYIRSL